MSTLGVVEGPALVGLAIRAGTGLLLGGTAEGAEGALIGLEALRSAYFQKGAGELVGIT